jgi:hypothetical protein
MEILRQCMILCSVLSTILIQLQHQWMLLRAIVERLPVVKARAMKGCSQMRPSAPSKKFCKTLGREKNLAPRKPPVDIPSIHESSCSEEVDDSIDEVVRPKPALKKMRRGCDADKVLRKTDEVQEATSQSKARSLARSVRQVKLAKTIQARRLTRSTKLF